MSIVWAPNRRRRIVLGKARKLRLKLAEPPCHHEWQLGSACLYKHQAIEEKMNCGRLSQPSDGERLKVPTSGGVSNLPGWLHIVKS